MVGGVTAELWLVRHGETEWTCAGRLCGRSDPPLTERGRTDASALRAALAGATFERVVSSPAARAVETARLAYGEPVLDARLHELDFGDLEGTTWADCSDDVRRSLIDYTGFCAPGGESVAELGERVLAALTDLGPGRHLVFSHGGVIRFLLGLAAETAYPQPATVTRLGLDHEPGWSGPPRAFILGEGAARVAAARRRRVEESRDSTGQDAGEIPGGATRGKRNREQTASGDGGKGETVR